jgi:hypothetical protein
MTLTNVVTAGAGRFAAIVRNKRSLKEKCLVLHSDSHNVVSQIALEDGVGWRVTQFGHFAVVSRKNVLHLLQAGRLGPPRSLHGYDRQLRPVRGFSGRSIVAEVDDNACVIDVD